MNGIWNWIRGDRGSAVGATTSALPGMRVMKRARAARVVFFYPGEEGTYIDQPMVTLYENGIIHIVASHEETTAHLQNCEIMWRITADLETGDRSGKVKMLRPTKNMGIGNSFDSGATDPSEPPESPRT